MPLPKQLPKSFKDNFFKDSLKTSSILANRYSIVKSLGAGSCGNVYLVTDLKSTDSTENKVIKKIFIGNVQMDETVMVAQEANLLKHLNHQNIVKFYDSFILEESFCILTEYCNNGDLDTKINYCKKDGEKLEEELVSRWLIEMLLAIAYLHNRKILHRDLKTKNIFLHDNEIKIGDFGVSKIMPNSFDMAETFVGTPFYMSPEVLKHEGYHFKSDIWSIGCILYDMVSLNHPFVGSSLMEVMFNITEGPPPKWPHNYSSQLEKLFLKMVEKNASRRITAVEALSSSLIQERVAQLSNSDGLVDQYYSDMEIFTNKDYQSEIDVSSSSSKLKDLKMEAEMKFLKNMAPRDRIRLEKQRRADMEADNLKQMIANEHKETKEIYMENKKALNPYESTLFLGNNNQGKTNYKKNEAMILNEKTNTNATNLTVDQRAQGLNESEWNLICLLRKNETTRKNINHDDEDEYDDKYEDDFENDTDESCEEVEDNCDKIDTDNDDIYDYVTDYKVEDYCSDDEEMDIMVSSLQSALLNDETIVPERINNNTKKLPC